LLHLHSFPTRRSSDLTKQGKGMRAVSQDPDAAAIMGVNVNRTISFTFALAGGLAGVAGLLYLIEFNIRYDTGFELGLIAFTAAVDRKSTRLNSSHVAI